MTKPVTRQALDAALAPAAGGADLRLQGSIRGMVYTPGVQQMAETADAHWLIDAIGSYVLTEPALHPDIEPFQVWKIEPDGRGGAVLTMKNTDHHAAPERCRQVIPWTDFPLHDEEGAAKPFVLWLGANGPGEPPTLMLPSEY